MCALSLFLALLLSQSGERLLGMMNAVSEKDPWSHRVENGPCQGLEVGKCTSGVRKRRKVRGVGLSVGMREK